jgi:preprotein translocase SecF subunit
MYPVFNSSQDEAAIEQAIADLKLDNASVQFVSPFGKAARNEYLVQFAGASTRIIDTLEQTQGADRFEVLQVEEVGQKVGSELRTQALGAVLISILFILGYIWFRFDFEFSPGAIVALVHDSIAVLGVFAFLQLPFDLSTVAAVLTIVGFSINDTIVTYDRIRENLKKVKGMGFVDIVNKSINETLSRTVLTSITLLMATLMLLFYGGVITQNFALALTLGVVFGTYSTVFIASPLTIYTRKYFASKG